MVLIINPINPINQETAGQIILESARYIDDAMQSRIMPQIGEVEQLLRNLDIIPRRWRDYEWVRVRLALTGLEEVLK